MIKEKGFTFMNKKWGVLSDKKKGLSSIMPLSQSLARYKNRKNIKTNQRIELLKIHDKRAQSKTYIIEIFKH